MHTRTLSCPAMIPVATIAGGYDRLQRNLAMPKTIIVLPLLCTLALAQGWTDVTPANPNSNPTHRAFAAMCWDAENGYILMAGGYGPGATGHTTASWDGTAWTQYANSLPQSGVNSSEPQTEAMAFDVPSRQVLLFFHGVTYRWNGSTWINAQATLGGSGAVNHVAMGHDPISNQTVMFVGMRFSGTPTFIGTTYLWIGNSWVPQATMLTPWPMRYPTMTFDPSVGRLVLSTTDDGTYSAFFEWNGFSWVQRFPANAPGSTGTMATDTVNDSVLVLDGDLDNQPGHTWNYANGTLAPAPTAAEPARRFGAAMAFDPVRERMVMYGGSNHWNPTANILLTLGDTWEFTPSFAASWTAFGAGCAGTSGIPTLSNNNQTVPHVGQTLQLRIDNVPPAAPIIVLLGLSKTSYNGIPLPFSLAGIGAPGCMALCSAEASYVASSSLGTALWLWTVPNAIGVKFYNQAFALDSGANALGVIATNAGAGTIGL